VKNGKVGGESSVYMHNAGGTGLGFSIIIRGCKLTRASDNSNHSI
jgi:hypothetical protein